MPIKHFFTFILLFASSLKTSAQIFDDSLFINLDYGLYWAGENNAYEKSGPTTQAGSSYYDPNKPTIIYIHGWQNGSSEDFYRELLYSENNGRPDVDFAQLWRSHGYNIGIMYWNQFADESEVKDAERKLWSTDGGMRWKDPLGDFHYEDVSQPVPELLLEEYLVAMSEFTGPEIRLAGHSLGNQVAIRIASLLVDQAQDKWINNNLIPKRISLLDAFYSNGEKDYLNGLWTGEASRGIVDTLVQEGIAIDSYRSSLLTTTIFAGDENVDLHNSVAFVEMSAPFFSVIEQSEKHSAAVWLYLWSIAYQAPDVEDQQKAGISASSSNELIYQWMNENKHLRQVGGKHTKDPVDNVFVSTPRLN